MKGMLYRVEALITQYHGNTDFAKDYYKSGKHLGLDTVPINRREISEDAREWEVFCPMSGKVMFASEDGPYGISAIIYNEDLRASLHFAHLKSLSVKEGWVVGQNVKVGVVGSTGNSTARHLHLGYIPMKPYGNRLFSDTGNPYFGCLDPLGFLISLGVKI